MTSLLISLVLAASSGTYSKCAAIENFTNTVAWRSAGRVHTTTYRDTGERLVYRRNVPGVVRMAAATLSIGPAGVKVRVACNVRVTR